MIELKDLIIVSKTHLDLGFTDSAEAIKKRYLDEYIPAAVALAENLNRDGVKRFVWTTGAWILSEALRLGEKEGRESLIRALRQGDIAPHALPFTTHTELLDKDLFRYGLSIADGIDAICGKKTVAAKMTDVPGHTGAIVPLLAERGIKLLHVGVNGASVLPEVPECFLWKFGGAEVVVIYSGAYGGIFKSEFIDEILYFDHTLDNRGAKGAEEIIRKFDGLQRQYPDYTVRAGRMDDVADALWEVRNQLPVVEDEIGDTWIHGIATDPYKTGAFRRLCALKSSWLADGSLARDSAEYCGLANALLCVAEHTWGMDAKTHFGDMENYLKSDFNKARARDVVRIRRPFGYFPNSFVCYLRQSFGKKKNTYSEIERSWAEQRRYLSDAVAALSPAHAEEAARALAALRPTECDFDYGETYPIGKEVTVGENTLSVSGCGGVRYIVKGCTVLDAKDRPLLEYRSYGAADYAYWLQHYTRDYSSTRAWAEGDFARPGLDRYEGRYPVGLFGYSAGGAKMRKTDEGIEIKMKLVCDRVLSETLGAPTDVFAEYRLSPDGLSARLLWLKKDAVRTTESIALRFYPVAEGGLTFEKMGEKIDPAKTVSCGGRKLAATEAAYFTVGEVEYRARCVEAPLVATDGGNILHFDNKISDNIENGLSYILYDNVWGTNFPLWYGESAVFHVSISPCGRADVSVTP